eukprot:scaffold7763_cov71-Skeletonema_dohrnii-CCMP3373.AAC.1
MDEQSHSILCAFLLMGEQSMPILCAFQSSGRSYFDVSKCTQLTGGSASNSRCSDAARAQTFPLKRQQVFWEDGVSAFLVLCAAVTQHTVLKSPSTSCNERHHQICRRGYAGIVQILMTSI